MTETSSRVEGAKRMAVRQRNYRRVRDRALVRLANAYPETYKELLEQEKVKIIMVHHQENLLMELTHKLDTKK